MTGGECRKRGQERGLWYEIKCIEDTVKLKEEIGKDASWEKELLEAYRKYRPEEYNKMLNGQA